MSISVLSGLHAKDGQYRHRPIAGGLDVLVVNLMPNQLMLEKQLLRAWMSVRENLNLTFTLMTSQVETSGDANEVADAYSLYAEIKDNHYDVVFVTGSPYDGQEESTIPFWDDFVDLIHWSETHARFEYFAGWSAAGAFEVKYGIHVPHKRKKIFGIFEQQITESYLFEGTSAPYLMPVSRWFNFSDIKLPAELQIYSKDSTSGPGIIGTADTNTLYVTGHPTVQGTTFHEEYETELAEGRITAPPTNLQYVNGKPLATWAINATQFYENWFEKIGKVVGKVQPKF
jgi:homoserine O-succinyltransferase